MGFAPRLLEVAGEEALRRELLAIGAEPAEAGQLASGLDHRLVRMSAVPAGAAARVRDLLLPLGGDAVILAAGGFGVVEIILSASPTVLRLLAQRLSDRTGGLPALGGELAAMLRGLDQPPAALAGCSCRLSLDRPLIMGVLNITPDSFSDGGHYLSRPDALRRGEQLAAEGADLIDIGGESTRPGAPAVSLDQELDRVLPVIEALRREVAVPLSIDTTKSEVARAAVAAGAEFVNDVSGLHFDPQMATAVAESGAGLFLMHTRGRPDRMQHDTRYQDLLGEILAWLRLSLAQAAAAGIPSEKLAVDPGIGFGKSAEGNLEILRRLGELRSLGRPILLGTSRKSFIGRAVGQADPQRRLFGTVATVALGVAAGAHLFRVHEVRPAREAALMAWAIRRGELPSWD